MNRQLLPALALCTVLAACGDSDDDAEQQSPQAETTVGSDSDANTGATGGADSDTPAGNDSNEPASSPDMDGGETSPDNDSNSSSQGGDDTSTPVNVAARYELTFINLTAGQPLSPPAVLAHQAGYKLFTLGKPSTVGLEMLAEGAATGGLIDAANATGIVWTGVASDQGPIGPGAQSTITVDLPQGADPMAAYLSAASMLVNTNDAITAVRGLSLRNMTVGSSMVIDLNSYDTGTEANDEIGAHIPGPVGGGAGFDAQRDDIIDAVLPHPGAISVDDGLAGSALHDINRWNDPVARLRVRRVQ